MTQTKDKPFCLEDYKDLVSDGDKPDWYSFDEEKVKTALAEFMKKIKEEDLYRSLIRKYGKVKIWNLNPQEMIELIEDYYNQKINKEVLTSFGKSLIPQEVKA